MCVFVSIYAFANQAKKESEGRGFLTRSLYILNHVKPIKSEFIISHFISRLISRHISYLISDCICPFLPLSWSQSWLPFPLHSLSPHTTILGLLASLTQLSNWLNDLDNLALILIYCVVTVTVSAECWFALSGGGPLATLGIGWTSWLHIWTDSSQSQKVSCRPPALNFSKGGGSGGENSWRSEAT